MEFENKYRGSGLSAIGVAAQDNRIGNWVGGEVSLHSPPPLVVDVVERDKFEADIRQLLEEQAH